MLFWYFHLYKMLYRKNGIQLHNFHWSRQNCTVFDIIEFSREFYYFLFDLVEHYKHWSAIFSKTRRTELDMEIIRNSAIDFRTQYVFNVVSSSVCRSIYRSLLFYDFSKSRTRRDRLDIIDDVCLLLVPIFIDRFVCIPSELWDLDENCCREWIYVPTRLRK